MDDERGGTSPEIRKKLLDSYGVPSHLEEPTRDNILHGVANRQGVAVSVDPALYPPGSSSSNPPKKGTMHCVTVVGAVYDEDGNLIAYYINDTGSGECNKRVPAADFDRAIIKGRALVVTNGPLP
jgi:hypothetical protein